jgi:Methyltransferase FkbM domain
MKVDVEGHELQVLLGAAKLMERDLPRIYVECLTEAHFSDVAQHLGNFGYRAIACFGDSPTFAFSTKVGGEFMTSSDLGFAVAAIHRGSVRIGDAAMAKAARKRQVKRVAKAQSAQRREAQRAAKAEAALERVTKSGTYRLARLMTWPARKLRKLWRSTVRLELTGWDALGTRRE